MSVAARAKPLRHAVRAAARRAPWKEAAWAAGTALVALVLTGWVMRLWRLDLSLPLVYEFDAQYYAMVVKSVLDHGWYATNPDLGTPFGHPSYDFPQFTDNLQLLAFRVLGLFFSGYPEVVHVYYVATYPLVALAAYLVLRRLGASPGPALVCAVLFALLPYHFRRSELHLFLSAYFAVPVGALLVMRVFAGEPLWARRPRVRGLRAWASRRSLTTLACCLIVGSASAALYYATFTLLLLVVAVGLTFLVRRRRSEALAGLAVVGAIVGVMAVNLAPALVYRVQHGPNRQAIDRDSVEAERFSLKLAQLVMPVNGHRIPAWRKAKREYVKTSKPPSSFNESHSATLGIVGALGLAWLALVGLGTLVARGRQFEVQDRYRHAAAAAGFAFLAATTGGISTLIAYGISPQIRAWNRLSVFIAFFALTAVALLLTALTRRVRSPGRRALAGVLLGLLLLVGVLDQTSSLNIVDQRPVRGPWDNDRAFVRAIERQMPAGAEVFQLPYMRFPEPKSIRRMYAYDALKGYLHSRDLRWSFGSVRGRRPNWPAKLQKEPIAVAVPAVAAAGFEGLWIDRAGYPARARAQEAMVQRVTGGRPLVSRDGRLAFYDLRPYARRLRAESPPGSVRTVRRLLLFPETRAALAEAVRHLRPEPRRGGPVA
jgi:hypothetical protein